VIPHNLSANQNLFHHHLIYFMYTYPKLIVYLIRLLCDHSFIVFSLFIINWSAYNLLILSILLSSFIFIQSNFQNLNNLLFFNSVLKTERHAFFFLMPFICFYYRIIRLPDSKSFTVIAMTEEMREWRHLSLCHKILMQTLFSLYIIHYRLYIFWARLHSNSTNIVLRLILIDFKLLKS
jgi:hypothetical protein